MTEWKDGSLRSLLFAPGSEPRKLARVADFGADAVVLDLEDAVAAAEKAGARELVRAAIPGVAAKGANVLARVNALSTGLAQEDIRSAVVGGLAGLVVPKVEDTDTLAEVDRLLRAAERAAGLAAGSVAVLALIETAAGLTRCEEILKGGGPRLSRAVFGSGDFSVDLGISLTADAEELHYARSRLVVASRAAGLAPPLDGPYLDITDDAGLRKDSARSRRLGLGGRVVVYPGQVPAVNEVYSGVAPDELEFFRHVVDAFEQAELKGSASMRVDGRFVDYPIYRLAKRRLAGSDAAPHPHHDTTELRA